MHQKLEAALGGLADPYLSAKTFRELGLVALTYIEEHYPSGIGMVVGVPMPDGAHPIDDPNSIYILGNREVMSLTIRKLRIEQKPVLDFSSVFVPRIYELWEVWRSQDSKSHMHEFCAPLLDDFYALIAEARLITTAYYVDGCQALPGPAKLLEICGKQNKLSELPPNYHRTAPPIEC